MSNPSNDEQPFNFGKDSKTSEWWVMPRYMGTSDVGKFPEWHTDAMSARKRCNELNLAAKPHGR